MGKTKDVTTETTREIHGTIFDDVFRTIAQKMPYLLIPLINEVFQTNYFEDIHFQQLRNEHYEKLGKIITDSILQIEDHTYHLECQSSLDGQMVIRMFEYDFSIALELAQKNNETFEIEFPQSCVLYIRNHRKCSLPDYHEAIVKFADGQHILYRVPILRAQNYTVDSIFEKRLLILLPYHILRYESFLKNSGNNTKKLAQLLTDYQKISDYVRMLRNQLFISISLYLSKRLQIISFQKIMKKLERGWVILWAVKFYNLNLNDYARKGKKLNEFVQFKI